MNSWDEDLEIFFSTHQKNLEQTYPGVKLSRLHELIVELAPFQNFNHEQLAILKSQLIQKIPLQYISKRAYFYRSSFLVDERVLIPRSESEIMVEKVVEFIKNNPTSSTVIEVGVGSGALLLSVLAEIQRPLEAYATDLSFSAMEVAKINFLQRKTLIHPQTSVNFYWADRLEGFTQKFDVIFSNPPYIKDSDDHLVHSQVKQFEPHMALFLQDESYDSWFAEFFAQVSNCLVSGGLFMMEGHENHLPRLQEKLATLEFTEVKLIKDYTDRWRFLSARRL